MVGLATTRPTCNKQKKKLAQQNLLQQVRIWDEFEGEHRMKFFKEIQLLSVPVRNGEAFGIYLSEAMASGIPVVQPKLGAFPEIVGTAGGGFIYQPNTPETLAVALIQLLDEPEKIGTLSTEARKSVENHFDINRQAEKMINVYSGLVKG